MRPTVVKCWCCETPIRPDAERVKLEFVAPTGAAKMGFVFCTERCLKRWVVRPAGGVF